jgi:NTE family protein
LTTPLLHFLRRAIPALLTALLSVQGLAWADRPRVGLVLGGGGARGAAHIGVLEVLEQLRVPVDCVAGTSMGALVAGVWASGRGPADMRREMARADWADLFQDNPAYADLNHRSKRLAQRFLPGSETGSGAQGPQGVVAGQKIKLFFNQLVGSDGGERTLQALGLPVSIIATDIGTGERVVFRDGSLSLAMRASMAVPGVMTPVDAGGRRLVDGGLVDNIPIREVRERCDAQVVIAVNVGSGLLPPQEVGGLLSVSTQVLALLTEQNVVQSLALLKPGDIYIRPDLDGLGPGAFERSGEAADRGRAAALALAPALSALAVDAPAYTAWRQRVGGAPAEKVVVDQIEIAGLSRVNPSAVARYITQPTGQPLDTQVLNRDLLRAYGDGFYEGVDYSLMRVRDRNVLRIAPVEKRWGPDYLRLGLGLRASRYAGTSFSLRAAYQKTWLNTLGGELLASAELGNSTGVAVDWYQPLVASQRFFVEAAASTRRERNDFFFDDRRLSQYLSAVKRIDLLAGANLGLLGQARVGWRESRVEARLETGLALLPDDPLGTAGWLGVVDIDQLDQLHVPKRGWSARLEWFESKRRDYNRVSFALNAAQPLGDWVIGWRGSFEGSTHGRLPVQDLARLGGFLNLSGFAVGQLAGDKVSYTHLRAERIVGNMPLGLRGDMRVGFALETGRVGVPLSEPRRTGWLDSATIYLGGETVLGPVYLGLGYSSSGTRNAYLTVGTP